MCKQPGRSEDIHGRSPPPRRGGRISRPHSPLGMGPAERLAEVGLVEQPGGEVLANDGNATAESDILALAQVR